MLQAVCDYFIGRYANFVRFPCAESLVTILTQIPQVFATARTELLSLAKRIPAALSGEAWQSSIQSRSDH